MKKVISILTSLVLALGLCFSFPDLSARATYLSPHFDSHEFACDCGCGAETSMSSELINRLEDLFALLNCSKIIVTSGYRHYSSDKHHDGLAADVILYDQSGSPINSRIVCCLAADMGINGVANINTNYRAVHIDVRSGSKYWGDEIYGTRSIWNQKGADGNYHDNFYEYFNLTKDEVYRYTSNYNGQDDEVPEKPVVHVEASTNDKAVKISWQNCANCADGYYYNIYNATSGEQLSVYDNHTEETQVNVSNVAPGNYYVIVTATHHWTWSITESEPVYFTVLSSEEIGHEMSESEAAGRTLPDGDYWIFNGLGTDYYLDVPGESISGGGNLEMWHCNNGMPSIYDVWTVTYLNNGFYSILQKNSAAGLDVCNAEMTRGTHVQMCNYNGNYAQQWSISKTGNGYQIRSRRNNFYLDVIGGSTEAGTGLWTYSQNDTAAQLFCFIPYAPDEQPLADGTYSIRTAVDTNYCMESEGNNIQVSQKSEYCNDTFDIRYRGDGWYSIHDNDTKLSLSVDRPNNEPYLDKSLNIVLREYISTRSQLWKLRKVTDNQYVMFSALNGYTLDMQGGDVGNGANAILYQYHGNDNQVWSFVLAPQVGESTVSVVPGTGSTDTRISWTSAENASKYNLRILSEQDGEYKSYCNIWNLTETEYSAVLPAGNYEFYVEAYNEYSQKASERVSFTVFDNPLSDEGITLSQTVFPYTGSAVKVGSYLSVKYNGKKLQYGTDFTTTYKNCVNAGYQTASVTVTGIGNYTGTVTKYYTITPAQQAAPVLTPVEGGFQAAWTKDTAAVGYQLQYCQNSSFTGDTLHSAVYTGTSAALTKYPADGETWYVRVRAFVSSDGTTAGTKYGVWSDAASCTVPLTLTDMDVTLSKTSLPYTGSAVKVGSYLTVRHNGKKLVYGTDFTTTYKNCVKAGYQTASVTVTGVGNYTGTVTKYYTITPAQQAAPVLTPVAGGFQAAWTKDSSAVGYQLQYCKNSSFTGDTLHSAVYTGTSAALTKYPADGETWFVRVRAFVSSDGTTAGTKYGVWSDAASCTVPLTLTDADVRLSKTVLPYTGSAVKVGSYLSVKYNGKKLVYGTDFTTAYKNCVKAGYQTASVTVTGIGNYTGTVTKYYTIAPAQQAAPQLSFDDKGLHVQWTADSRAVGYQVMYCQDESFASSDPTYHVAVYGAGKTSCDLTKYPKYGETWFVRVRAFVSSDGTTAGTRSGIWSETAAIRAIDTLEITKLPNTDDFYEYCYEPDWYDFACGEYEAIDVGWGTPAKIGNYIKVRSGGKKLVYGTDFTISYRNNVLNDGEWDKIATVTVRGTGEYYGTVSGQFLVFASP